MKGPTLQSVIRSRPFKPFTIQMASGDSFDVSHPETILVSQEGDVATIMPGHGQVWIIDVPSINAIVTHDMAASGGPDE